MLVFHDGTKILDTLIQRMARIGDNNKPSLGRELVYLGKELFLATKKEAGGEVGS